VNSPLAIQLMRFGFLVLLWLFVFASVRVVRADLRASGQPRIAVRHRRDAGAGRPQVRRRARGAPACWS